MNGSPASSSTGAPAGLGETSRKQRAALRKLDSSFRPVLALMSGRTVGFAAAFLIPVALARILDQAEFGTYKQLFLIAGTLYGMGQLGMAESLFYFLPRAGSRDGSRYVANSVAA